MPTVLRHAGYRFYFLAKYWLDPIELASSKRFRAHELGEVRNFVLLYRTTFLEAWHDHLED